MSEGTGRKPIGRIVVKNSKTGKSKTVATIWPLGDRGDGVGSMRLGDAAYKDRAAVSEAEALAALQLGNTKGSGYFINYYPNTPREAREERDESSAGGAADDLPF